MYICQMQWRKKQDCYRWTWYVRLSALLLFTFVFYLAFQNIYVFLSPQKPISAKILVVEGWLNDDALQESLRIFNEGQDRLLIVTGGPLNTGYIITNYRSTAEVARATLLKLGGDSNKIVSVSRDLVWRDRTYTTALKLRKYLQQKIPQVHSFNLVSLGAHSRRSWLLYKKAMPDYQIGIVSIKQNLYDSEHWWKTSKGFRSVFTETIGYFYVLFFF